MKKNNALTSIVRFLIVVVLLLPFLNARAQTDGTNDPTFNPTDIGFGMGDGPDGPVYSTALQSDGKALIAGAFQSYNGIPSSAVTRVNTDGSLDKNFNTSALGLKGSVSATSIQSDGKIILTGSFIEFKGKSQNRILRLNSDGTADTAFHIGTGADEWITAHAIQADGKIIICGDFNTYNGFAAPHIARLNTDGTFDKTFLPGSGTNKVINAVAIQNDGKIIIAGDFTDYDGTPKNRILRLSTTGTIDKTFDIGTGANGTVYKIVLQKDKKIVITGAFFEYNGVKRTYLARLSPYGILDTTFNKGVGPNQIVTALALLDNGQFLIGGSFDFYDAVAVKYFVRLNADASLDDTFNQNGMGPVYSFYSIKVQQDGQILIGGNFTLYNTTQVTNFARLNPDGSIEKKYNAGSGASGRLYASAVQPDGKILIGGEVSFFDGKSINRLARLNKDGTLDETFHLEKIVEDPIIKIAIQKDGKIIVGNRHDYGSIKNCITRLNADGTPDPAFYIGLGAFNDGSNAQVSAITIQPDGKILIGGLFDRFNTTTRNNIARLNADGTLDHSFDPQSGPDFTVNDIAVQNDGKIIIVGAFSRYQGIPMTSIARLNADGTLDKTFLATGTDYSTRSVVLQKDGKIIIAGYFRSCNGHAINGIARLNANGTFDETFNPGSGCNSIYAIALQEDGKIIIGGGFTSFDSIPLNGIGRINTDGTTDPSFEVGTGISARGIPVVETISIQDGDHLIIAGNFTGYNQVGRNRIARLFTSGATSVESYAFAEHQLSAYPNPFHSTTTLTLNTTPRNGSLQLLDLFGREVKRMPFSGTVVLEKEHLLPGVYFIRITEGETVIANKKLILQ